MDLENSISAEEIVVYLNCPRWHQVQFVERRDMPLQKPSWLLRDQLVRDALRLMHDHELTDELGVAEMVDDLLAEAWKGIRGGELGFDASEVRETVQSYARWAAGEIGGWIYTSEWLWIPLGQNALVDVVDAWWFGQRTLVAAIWGDSDAIRS